MAQYREAAERGDTEAQFRLGKCFQEGLDGATQDIGEAIKWYRQSAEQGNTEAGDRLLTMANQRYDGPGLFNVLYNQRYDSAFNASAQHHAFNAISELAKKGNSTGQYYLGRCYETGSSVTKDINEAIKCYSKSTEQGNTKAGDRLLSLAQGNKDALNAISKLANQGNSTGQYYLGRCYETCQYVSEAIKCYSKSAEQGNTEAGDRLLTLATQPHHDLFKGMSLASVRFHFDVAFNELAQHQAFHAISQLAKKGNSTGQYYLGRCYETGSSVTKDINEAIKWYSKSTEQGNTKAGDRLLSLAQGNTKAGDRLLSLAQGNKDALNAISKLANQGNLTAQFYLGRCYETGSGFTKDIKEAIDWYLKAAEQNDTKANDQLLTLAQEGNKDALNAISELAKKGNSTGQYCLGVCHENGFSVTKDINQAIKWYRQSTEQGNTHAGDRLLSLAQKGNKDAFNAISELANQGNSTGQCYLGQWYENGRDINEAIRWYRQSTEQGNTSGGYLLFGLAQEGNKDAFNAISELANQGNATGQYYLGRCFETGSGVTEEINEAIRRYRQSTEQGNAYASDRLLSLAQKGNKDVLNIILDLAMGGNTQALTHLESLISQALTHLENLFSQALSVLSVEKTPDSQDHNFVIQTLLLDSVKEKCDSNKELASLRGEYDQTKQVLAQLTESLQQLTHQFSSLAKDHDETKQSLHQARQELAEQKAENLRFKQTMSDSLQQLTHQFSSLAKDHDETKQSLHQARQELAEQKAENFRFKQTITSTLKLSQSDPKIQDGDGNTFLMRSLLFLESEVLTEPENVDLFRDIFARSPWHAVNRAGRSLAEIVLDERVPAAIRDHARAAMERAIADPNANPAHRSAAARALDPDEPLLPSSSSSSFFDIPFGNLPVYVASSSEIVNIDEKMNALEESARRVPQVAGQQLQSLIDMLQSVNTREMQRITRLERLLPDLEKRLPALKETHRWLSEYGRVQASENVDTDTLERIKDHSDLLQRQLREIEPIVDEVNSILPQLDANLSSLFPEIEGRADRISPKQLNDILEFIRQHHGTIAWHQESVVNASQTLMDALRNYAVSVRSAEGDLDTHHSFMKFFLAHLGSFCSSNIPTARQQIDEITKIRRDADATREAATRFKPLMEEIQSVKEEMASTEDAIKKLGAELEITKKKLKVQQDYKSSVEALLPEQECQATRASLAITDAIIDKLTAEINSFEQQLREANQTRQALTTRSDELKQKIVSNPLWNSKRGDFAAVIN